MTSEYHANEGVELMEDDIKQSKDRSMGLDKSLEEYPLANPDYNKAIPSVVAPSRLFKALILDSHNILPKIVPERIRSVELIEGDGGIGSIKKTNFGENSHIEYAKYMIDALDVGSFYCRYTMIESDIMSDNVDFVEKEVKFVAAGDGCVCKMNIEYHVKDRRDLRQADINEDNDRAVGFFTAVEEYLLANPNVCA